MPKYKVLLIEDDAASRRQLAKAVKKEDFCVLAAANGSDGLQVFEKEKPKIVITDLKMPGIDGLKLTRQIKNSCPHTQVILITAFGEMDTAVMALREGVLDYLKKPLKIDELAVALGRAQEKVAAYEKNLPYPVLLLAEDDESTRTRLADILETENWEVIQVADGEEAVSLFKRQKIDVALLDIRMPKKDGLQTLHEMRDLTDDFATVILSGYGDESSAVQALREGAVNFLKKPIDLETLIVSLEKALEHLSLARALKYRQREVELSNQLISKISKK